MVAGMASHPDIPEKDRVAYSIYEAAAACGVSDATIRRAIRDGYLVAHYPTTRAVILREELVAWIKSTPSERKHWKSRT